MLLLILLTASVKLKAVIKERSVTLPLINNLVAIMILLNRELSRIGVLSIIFVNNERDVQRSNVKRNNPVQLRYVSILNYKKTSISRCWKTTAYRTIKTALHTFRHRYQATQGCVLGC